MNRFDKLKLKLPEDHIKELIGRIVDLMQSYKLGIDKDTKEIVCIPERKKMKLNHVRCLLKKDIQSLRLYEDYNVNNEDLNYLVDETLKRIMDMHSSLGFDEVEVNVDGDLPS